MKNKRTLVTMLVVLALLAGVYAVLKNVNEAQEEDDKHYVTPLESPETVTAMEIEFGGDDYTLRLEEGVWYMSDDSDFPVDQKKAASMASGLRSVFADREIEAAAEPGEYGLDPAVCRITAWDGEGNTFAYRLGDLNEYANLYYLSYEGNDSLYLTDSTLPKLFLYNRHDMIEIEQLPDIYKTEVTAIAIKRGDETVKAERDGDWSDELSEVIASFYGLYFYDCVDFGVKGEKLAEYGLDEPVEATLWYVKTETKYTGVVDDEGREQTEDVEVEYQVTLLFGGDTDDGRTYVTLKDSDRVYIASRSECHIVMDADLNN